MKEYFMENGGSIRILLRDRWWDLQSIVEWDWFISDRSSGFLKIGSIENSTVVSGFRVATLSKDDLISWMRRRGNDAVVYVGVEWTDVLGEKRRILFLVTKVDVFDDTFAKFELLLMASQPGVGKTELLVEKVQREHCLYVDLEKIHHNARFMRKF